MREKLAQDVEADQPFENQCKKTFLSQSSEILRFRKIIKDKGIDPNSVLIVFINVDSDAGKKIANSFMPGHDWSEFRDKGEIPFMKGIADGSLRNAVTGSFDQEFPFNHIENIEDIPIVVIEQCGAQIFN
jgi:hypothetical protein